MPFSSAPYREAASQARQQTAAESAANLYSLRLSQQRGKRNLWDLKTQYSRGVPNVVSNYTSRGLSGSGVESGVANRGLQQYAANQYRATQDARNQMADNRSSYELQQAQLQADLQAYLAQLQMQLAQARAEWAAQNPNPARRPGGGGGGSDGNVLMFERRPVSTFGDRDPERPESTVGRPSQQTSVGRLGRMSGEERERVRREAADTTKALKQLQIQMAANELRRAMRGKR